MIAAMSLRLTRTSVQRILAVAIGVDLLYWILWFSSRSTVASDTRAAYVEFENAFPLADAWLAFGCVAALIALRRRSPLALLWLVAAGGGGLYLFGMDVLYDLEHGIYAKGAGGIIEAAINLITLTFSLVAMRWAWSNRTELLADGTEPAAEHV
jgi:hypothetical protein